MITPTASPYLSALQHETDQELITLTQSSHHAPRIGITAHLSDGVSSVSRGYTEAVRRAGGIPLIIPITEHTDTLYQTLREVDGLILSGGNDVHPYYLGSDALPQLGAVSPERDRCEMRIIQIAHHLSIPILGICRGMQLLGQVYGAELYQDISTEHTGSNALNHAPKIPREEYHHRIDPPVRGSRLERIMGEGSHWVNSLHHQALSCVAPPFGVVASAPDGIIEAIDAYPELDILAVQWHPEHLAVAGHREHLALFEHIVHRARLYRHARRLHRTIITLDSHTDTPMYFDDAFDLRYSERTRVDLTKMYEGMISTSVMVAYIPQGELSESGHIQARLHTEDRLDRLQHLVASLPSEEIRIATCPDEIARSRHSIITAIENGYALGDQPALLRLYRERYGIAYITLSHNGDNLLCDSARGSQRTHGGLSALGRTFVTEMNRQGILIDISHTSPETVRDVLELSAVPIIASHSSARALCGHARNLSDEEIRAIATRGGVVQVCLYAGFIHEDSSQASLLDAIDHIDHIVHLVGVEHVGIGSDFDGDGELIGCRTSRELIRLTMELIDRGYTDHEIELIWGGNFLRVWQTALDYAERQAGAN